jgi:hypothetical protein
LTKREEDRLKLEGLALLFFSSILPRKTGPFGFAQKERLMVFEKPSGLYLGLIAMSH